MFPAPMFSPRFFADGYFQKKRVAHWAVAGFGAVDWWPVLENEAGGYSPADPGWIKKSEPWRD